MGVPTTSPCLVPPLQLAELQDKATSAETKVLEMGTTVEGLQWDSAKLRKREGRLDRHLAEALEQVTAPRVPNGVPEGGRRVPNVPRPAAGL